MNKVITTITLKFQKLRKTMALIFSRFYYKVNNNRRIQIQTIIEALPSSVVVIDRNGDIKFSNCESGKVLQTNYLSLHGRNLLEYFSPSSSKELKKLINKLFVVNELGNQYSSDEKLDLALLNNNIKVQVKAKYSIGNIAFISIVDMTESLEEHNQLLDLKRTAEHSSQMKSLFLANMSHEIRTPLSAILGFAELIQSDLNSEINREHLRSIINNGRHLSSIVNDILDISKIEENKLKISYQWVDLDLELKSLYKTISALCVEKELDIDFNTSVLEGYICYTDQLRLRQILLNLLNNAAKFTEKGKISLDVKCNCGDVNSERVLIKFIVSDTGIGISQQAQSYIFRAFEQEDASIAGKYGGTGLGLSLSLKLSEMLGGKLELKSSDAKSGSVFELTLPMAVQKKSLCDLSTNHSVVSERESLPKKLKILYIEDSKELRGLLGIYLKQYDVEVEYASTGYMGLEMIGLNVYDIILIDIQLPDLDGHTIVQLLRRRGIMIPIVAISAHACQEQIGLSKKSGFDDYLVKPYDQMGLVEIILKNIRLCV